MRNTPQRPEIELRIIIFQKFKFGFRLRMTSDYVEARFATIKASQG
jgi:hypothetical protein